jgi:hypothetical protein
MESNLINENMILITEKFGKDYISAKDGKHIRYNCPFCQHRRGKSDNDYKMYVNYVKGAFYCFKCHAKGRFGKPHVDPDNVYKYLKIYEDSNTDLCKDDDSEEDNVFFLSHIDIADNTEAFKYLKSRHVTRELIDYYNIRLGTNELFGRVVVPNILLGKEGIWTDMFSARSYIGQKPKYLNPEGCKKTNSVFNLHRTNKNGRVYIVEGVMTAINAGKEGICTYGSSPSEQQLTSILDMNYEEMYCIYDNDPSGVHGNQELAEGLSKRNSCGTIFTVIMPPGIDAADMGEEKFKKYVEQNKEVYYSSAYSKLFNFVKGN